MRLDEAKKILNKMGYVLEDTETQDEEFDKLTDEIKDELDSIPPKEKIVDKDFDKLDKLSNKQKELINKHADLENKIYDSIYFNSIKDGLDLRKILSFMDKKYKVATDMFGIDCGEIRDYYDLDYVCCDIKFENVENIDADVTTPYAWTIRKNGKIISVSENTYDLLEELKKLLKNYKKGL